MISSAYAPKLQNNNKKQNTSFKADVKIEPASFWKDEMPESHAVEIRKLLERAKTHYKNIGNDNMIITVKPATNGKFKESKIKSFFKFSYGFKDPEKARKDILRNLNDPEFLEKHKREIPFDQIKKRRQLLESKDPRVMNFLYSFRYSDTNNPFEPGIGKGNLKACETAFDANVEAMVGAMEKAVVVKDELFKVKGSDLKFPLSEKLKARFRAGSED